MPNKLDIMDSYWATRRLPVPVLRILVAHPKRLIVAGGYLRSVVSNEPVTDIDIFGPSAEYLLACASSLVADAQKGRLVETDNAYTVYGAGLPIQFIHRWAYQEPAEILASFDFTVCQAALWFDGDNWDSVVGDTFYADLAGKRLRYLCPQRNEDAGGSLLRVLKYYQRGYRIPLDSLGAVIARLLSGVCPEDIRSAWGSQGWQERLTFVLTGLLREVDPLVDPMHRAHLPTIELAQKAMQETGLEDKP